MTARVIFGSDLEEFLESAQRIVDEDYAKFSSDMHNRVGPQLSIDSITSRTKYARIITTDSSGSRSVWGFVGLQDGNIWKAAGWKAPALNFPRGNILKNDWYDRASWTSIS